ncbi:MAG: protein translocase subunit SecF [Blastocatellia bacterium]|nr:protein translocase subunit SecF [Blastocatellia bacterium]
MIEIFRDPKIDWIGSKKYFIIVSIVLMLVGAISVQLRGFNLGVDFTGGTLMTVRFTETQTPERIRSVLAASPDIDTSKVTIQPVLSRPNELIIRTPQLSGSEAERRVDEDKRKIIRALQRINPAGDVSGGKVNVNTIDAEGVEQELRQSDPLGIKTQQFPGMHPYRQIGEQIVAFRDGQQKVFLEDISALEGLTLSPDNLPDMDQGQIKAALARLFYAGKIDLNLSSINEIEEALGRIDPLGIREQANAGETYKKAAEAIKQYRTDRDGVINNLSEIQVADVSADLLSKMDPYFMTGGWSVVSAEVVGPQVGADLRNRAIYVTLAALAGMLVYIAFRFEWIYGVAAVVAVFHDVMVTLGIFSMFRNFTGWEISLTVVAALLTLVGYSMNDTIVIFDRIRENLRLRRRDSLLQITNDSINQTLSRTIMTSGLTFISVLSIVLFGGEVLRGFGLALTIGILVGSYSSIAVASPIMLWWEYRMSGKGGSGRGKTDLSRTRTTERSLARV